MEEASARADEAVMTAINHKDAKKAMAVAKEMRHAADEAGAMTWALTAMEHTLWKSCHNLSTQFGDIDTKLVHKLETLPPTQHSM